MLENDSQRICNVPQFIHETPPMFLNVQEWSWNDFQCISNAMETLHKACLENCKIRMKITIFNSPLEWQRDKLRSVNIKIKPWLNDQIVSSNIVLEEHLWPFSRLSHTHLSGFSMFDLGRILSTNINFSRYEQMFDRLATPTNKLCTASKKQLNELWKYIMSKFQR